MSNRFYDPLILVIRIACAFVAGTFLGGCDVQVERNTPPNSSNSLVFAASGGTAIKPIGDFERAGTEHGIRLWINSKLVADLDDLAGILGQSKAEPDVISLYRSDPSQAMVRIGEIIRQNPENGFAYYVRGVFHFELGEYNRTIEDVSIAIKKISPEIFARKKDALANIYATRGNAYLATKNVHLAIIDYSEAMANDPRNPDLHCFRGVAYNQQRDHASAINDFSLALRLSPNNAFAHFGRAAALQNLGQLQPALDDYSAGLSLDPDYVDGVFNRASVLSELGRHQDAVADLNRYLSINSNDVEALTLRANQYYCLSEKELAVKDLSAAIRNKADDYDLFMRRGHQFLELGQWEKAKTDFTVAFELNPTNASIQNNLAWLLATCPIEDLRNGHKAIDLAKKAIHELPSLGGTGADPSCSFIGTLAAGYAEVGDFDQATKLQKQVISMLETNHPYLAEEEMRLKLFESKKPFRQAEP